MFDGLSQLRAVFDAADALLAAREAQMVTRQEWDDLNHAVTAAHGAEASERLEFFAVEGDHLIRRVAPENGMPYERRCPQGAFEAVVRAVADCGPDGFVLADLCRRSGVSRALAGVAFAFLKARGRIANKGRRMHVATRGFRVAAAVADYQALAREPTDALD